MQTFALQLCLHLNAVRILRAVRTYMRTVRVYRPATVASCAAVNRSGVKRNRSGVKKTDEPLPAACAAEMRRAQRKMRRLPPQSPPAWAHCRFTGKRGDIVHLIPSHRI